MAENNPEVRHAFIFGDLFSSPINDRELLRVARDREGDSQEQRIGFSRSQANTLKGALPLWAISKDRDH